MHPLNVHDVDLLKSILNQIKMHLYFEMRTGLLPEGRGRVGTWFPPCQKPSHTLPPLPHPQHKIYRKWRKDNQIYLFTNHISCSNQNSKAASGIKLKVGYWGFMFDDLKLFMGGGVLSSIKIKLLAYLTSWLFSGPSTWTYVSVVFGRECAVSLCRVNLHTHSFIFIHSLAEV